MYNKILNQIANIIFINIQHVKYHGLLKGKLGIALFFYRYAKYTNNNMYSDFADEYIEYIYNIITKLEPLNFSDGLAGIGWGIDYAIRNKFVETEDGNILEEVDSAIIGMSESDFILEMDSDFPLFSKGLYFIQKENLELVNTLILNCEQILMRENKIPITYLNSVFYFINKAIDMDNNFETSIYDKLYVKVLENKIDKVNKMDQCILLRNIHNIPIMAVQIKWSSLIEIIGAVNDINVFNISWVELIYPYKNCDHDKYYDLVEIQNLLNNSIQNLDYSDLVLYNGLAGLGLRLLSMSEINQ